MQLRSGRKYLIEAGDVGVEHRFKVLLNGCDERLMRCGSDHGRPPMRKWHATIAREPGARPCKLCYQMGAARYIPLFEK